MKRYLLTGAALAAAIGCAATADTQLHGYLPPGAIDGVRVIGPPPLEGSNQERADRATYLETRALAGSPRWARAIKDDDLWDGGAVSRLSCVMGVRLAAQTTPRTYRVLQQIELDVRTVGLQPKKAFNRTRPFMDNDLPICIARGDWMKGNASYPSGHSMTGWAWGLVLSELAPDKTGPLMEAGGAIGDSRFICGVHYRSDVEAGRRLGAAMVARLHADAEFQKDLAAARQELRHIHTAAPADCPA